MDESVLQLGNEYHYVRHNKISFDKETLLFLHGLGDSGLCFQEVFQDKRFDRFNIIVPDIIGYGRSSSATNEDYSFSSYITKLWKLIERMNINGLTVIGHSMGGDIAAILCDSDQRNVIKKFVNIEGNITQFDLFISSNAVKAAEDANFEHWFYEEFMKSIVFDDWAQKYSSCQRYYASLWYCRTKAFLANAEELCKRSMALPGKYKSEFGKSYCSLTVPKMYCYGTESISSGTVDFLKEEGLKYQIFDGIFHWPMIDKASEFYSFLYEFVSNEQ
jgi:pimeloyl-ACP methyl ester carboxylesterase